MSNWVRSFAASALLWLCAAPAEAQPAAPDDPPPAPSDSIPADEPPPAPDDPAPPPPPKSVRPPPAREPASPEPTPESPAPAPEPAEPAPAPAPTPPPPPAPPPSHPRYEGQIDSEGEAGEIADDYSADYGADEDEDSGAGRGGRGFEMPAFSIRIDPFNWLLEGRLGVELEVAVWKFISVELVPVFVANTEPPSFNFSGRDDPVSQHSNGIGPIAGTSIGAGFWLTGRPFNGYVVRAIYTNYGFTYRASDRAGVFDEVDFTERRIMGYFGSQSAIGIFAIGGGIGIAYELNQQQRCFGGGGGALVASSSCGDDDAQDILIERTREDGRAVVADINGGLHPFYLEARISLGVVFE